MKKNLFSTMMCAGLAGMFMASCSNDIEDLFDPTYATTKAQYKAEWIKQFGEINPQHNWGFGSAETRALTRGTDPNANMWGGYIEVPAPLTDAQSAVVTEWFANNQNPQGVAVNWSDFFIQQVSSSEYGKGMQYLMDGTGHSFNFNAGDCGLNGDVWGGELTDPNDQNTKVTYADKIQLIKESSTSTFSYFNSNDSKAYERYVIIPGDMIDPSVAGMYFVAFDYEAHQNMEITADGYYNDWIVKITPGIYKNASRIICEDLGTIGDFDFNDLVFDAYVETDWSTGSAKYTAIITVRAAGGTMPIYIGDKEIHEAFGVEATTMVNTNATNGASKPVVVFRVPVSSNDLNQISIKVQGTEAQYSLDAPQGDAPQKICVKPSFKWCDERVNILTAYPGFADYSQNPEAVWY